MKHKKKLVILLLLLIVGSAAAYKYSQRRSHDDPNLIRVSGNIEITDAEASFKIAGRVEERLVSEGEMVNAGQVVARLDSSELSREVALRRAELRTAQSVVAELEVKTLLEVSSQHKAVEVKKVGSVTIRTEYRKCGKCCLCNQGKRHGPYKCAYWWVNSRTRSEVYGEGISRTTASPMKIGATKMEIRL